MTFRSCHVDAPMVWLFPTLRQPLYMDTSGLVFANLQGQWWLLGVTLVSQVFNHFLGEQFLFRGVLLPRMHGVFGKYDWVANSVLFGLYHLHKPWHILGVIVGSLAITWPARRFRTNWMAIIIHSAEAIPVLVFTLAVILGLLH